MSQKINLDLVQKFIRAYHGQLPQQQSPAAAADPHKDDIPKTKRLGPSL